MNKIANQLDAIVKWTKQLAKNLNIKGVGTSENETLNTLVPKVLSIVNSGDVTLGEKEITEDGEYYAYQDNLDGYSRVNVNLLGNYDFIGSFANPDSYTTKYQNIKMLKNPPREAFSNAKLNEVDLTKVENVGSVAFANSELKKVIAPLPLKIDAGAFRGCTGMEGTITISEEQIVMESYSFYNCYKLKTILHDGITEIKEHAFYQNFNNDLESLPESLQTIGNYAFYGCNSLKINKIPNVVKTIGSNAFRNSVGITSIELGTEITSLGGYCFAINTLKKVTIHKTTPPSLLSTVFNGCPLEIVEVPASALETYKRATNWSTYADIMIGIEGE